MKIPTDQLDPGLEAEFSDVIDRLELPDMRLRRSRRAVVLAAFEQARAAASQDDARFPWARAAALAAAIMTLALICYAIFVPQRNSGAPETATASVDAAGRPTAEHPALPELNVTLAIVNARTAAAERELAWLTAMRDEAGRLKGTQPNPFEQP